MSDLTAVAVVERDSHGEVMCVWAYPSIDNASESVLVSRAFPHDDSDQTGQGKDWFAKLRNVWQYFASTNEVDSLSLPGIQAITVCVLSPVFNPPKYGTLARVFLEEYTKSNDPVSILSQYLNAFTKKRIDDKWNAADYDNKQALLSVSSLASDVIEVFGVSSVILWVALLLKKRVAVLGEDVNSLMRTISPLPRLVWQRQNWSILRPHVNPSNPVEMADLKGAGVFVAGFTDPSIRSVLNSTETDLYDVLVDIPGRQIMVSASAKEDFRMGEMHKGVAQFMVQAAEQASGLKEKKAGARDSDLIKGLFQKTSKIIQLVKTMHEKDSSLSAAVMEEHNVPKPMHRFMYNVAVAENVVGN